LFHQGYFEACENPTTGWILRLEPCKGRLVRKPIDCIKPGICHFAEREKETKGTGFLAAWTKVERNEDGWHDDGATAIPLWDLMDKSMHVHGREIRHVHTQHPLSISYLETTAAASSEFELVSKKPGTFAIPSGDVF
jgi:hypothetical protein